jgi:phage terminase large subunit GpA-like protein
MDEVDAYPQDADGEGDPAELAIKRQTTFSNAKRIVTSTPTVKGFSKVDARFLATDQCFYHVPCPHCGTMQPLEMGYTSEWGLKWKKHKDGSPILKTVAYICRQCGSEIDESHKTQMLDNGMWVPKHPENGIETRGFQLSSLYSPLGWLSWRAIVDEYHKARMAEKMGDNTLMKVFVNTREGEVFEESGDKTDSNELKNRAGTWDLRVVLKGHYVITVGVDVQGDRLHMVAWAWGRKMSRQLVDRKVFYGDPAREEGMADSPWTKLTEWLNTPIYNELGKQISVLAGFIDSGGHHTQQVYRYCKAHQNRHIYPCKGQSIKNKPIIGKPSEPEVHWSGRKMRCGLKLWPIGTDTAKTEIYGHMRVNIPGDGFMSLTKKAGDDFFDQIASEILVTKLVRGRPVQEWILPPGKRNEDLDCTVYALAAAIYAGVDKWQDGDFLVLKDKLENDIPAQQMQQSQQTQSIKPKKPPKLPRMFQ